MALYEEGANILVQERNRGKEERGWEKSDTGENSPGDRAFQWEAKPREVNWGEATIGR